MFTEPPSSIAPEHDFVLFYTRKNSPFNLNEEILSPVFDDRGNIHQFPGRAYVTGIISSFGRGDLTKQIAVYVKQDKSWLPSC